ncbi:MAG: hypothetical protein IIA09_06995 [Proteobacteria bacterium]|nr:hypothetical protein [Pseudomonadota bacterium]
MRIFKDDDLISEVSADAVKLADMSVPDNDTDGLVERAQVVQFQATLTPVKLENNCVFRVRAQTDSEELRCPALRVEQAQPAGT